jgi:hypothetical protein
MSLLLRFPFFAAVVLFAYQLHAADREFPMIEELKPQAELPDPLTTLDGKKVTTVEQWEKQRKPELKALF